MPSDDKAVSRRERFARLNHDCKAIGIWMNEEENTMKLEELKAMSTKELTALYNQYADKRVKRMESRAKLEERTIQKLREAGKLDEGKTEECATNENNPTNPNSEDATMAKTATTTKKSAKTATKKAPAKKATKAPAKKSSEGSAKRGAPTKNPTYVAIAEGSRGYNPKNLRINPTSSRAQVLEYIAKAPNGRTKKQCEEKFADTPEVNVLSSLYYLVRHGFVSVKDEG